MQLWPCKAAGSKISVPVPIFGHMIDERTIRKRYAAIRNQVNERGQRLFAAAEAQAVGKGGIAAVCRV